MGFSRLVTLAAIVLAVIGGYFAMQFRTEATTQMVRADELARQLTEAGSVNTKLNGQVADLDGKLKAAANALEAAKGDSGKMTAKIQELSGQTSSTTAERDQLKGKVGELTSQMSALTGERDKLKAQVDDLTKKLKEMTAKAAAATASTGTTN